MGRLVQEGLVSNLLTDLDVGRIKGVAYDTAWLARPLKGDNYGFGSALRWLLRYQKWDGSWGSEILNRHDRVLSTTAAVIALELNERKRFKERIERGLDYLWDNIGSLDEDPYETIASELLLPSLVDEAQDLGMNMPDIPSVIRIKRQRKLSLIPQDMEYSSKTSLNFSMEFLGKEVDPEQLEDCFLPNGSIGCSPSATMFLLQQKKSAKAKDYLRWVSTKMASGGFPALLPFETFEFSWVMYNLMKAGWKDVGIVQNTLDWLGSIWESKSNGVSWGKDFLCSDSDTSSMAFKVLRDTGHRPDPSFFEHFELDDGFKCFEFELNPSVSANVHMLEALQDVPSSELPRRSEMIEKILCFLKKMLIKRSWWVDKWHISPYYPTGHAILALAKYEPSLIEGPVDWLIESQREDGGWGNFDISTVEETSYAMQGLMEYHTNVAGLDPTPLIDGASFLLSRINSDLERFWVAKALYCPVNVVKSSVIACLLQYESLMKENSWSHELEAHGATRSNIETVKGGGV